MRDHLSALDLSFLLIEKPAVHMHVGGISIFDPVTRPGGTLSFGELRRHLESRLYRMPRLRQHLQAGGRWVDDREFDLDRHLFNEALPEPGGQVELEALVGRLLSEQLDRRHPLWEMYFVEGLAGGRVAVVPKSHDAMGDGLAGLHDAEELFDSSPRPFRPGPVRPWRPEAEPYRSWRLLEGLLDLPIALPDLGRAASMTAMAAAGLAGFVANGMKAPSSPLNGRLSQEAGWSRRPSRRPVSTRRWPIGSSTWSCRTSAALSIPSTSSEPDMLSVTHSCRWPKAAACPSP